MFTGAIGISHLYTLRQKNTNHQKDKNLNFLNKIFSRRLILLLRYNYTELTRTRREITEVHEPKVRKLEGQQELF